MLALSGVDAGCRQPPALSLSGFLVGCGVALWVNALAEEQKGRYKEPYAA